jgi:hypothetical protein
MFGTPVLNEDVIGVIVSKLQSICGFNGTRIAAMLISKSWYRVVKETTWKDIEYRKFVENISMTNNYSENYIRAIDRLNNYCLSRTSRGINLYLRFSISRGFADFARAWWALNGDFELHIRDYECLIGSLNKIAIIYPSEEIAKMKIRLRRVVDREIYHPRCMCGDTVYFTDINDKIML